MLSIGHQQPPAAICFLLAGAQMPPQKHAARSVWLSGPRQQTVQIDAHLAQFLVVIRVRARHMQAEAIDVHSQKALAEAALHSCRRLLEDVRHFGGNARQSGQVGCARVGAQLWQLVHGGVVVRCVLVRLRQRL